MSPELKDALEDLWDAIVDWINMHPNAFFMMLLIPSFLPNPMGRHYAGSRGSTRGEVATRASGAPLEAGRMRTRREGYYFSPNRQNRTARRDGICERTRYEFQERNLESTLFWTLVCIDHRLGTERHLVLSIFMLKVIWRGAMSKDQHFLVGHQRDKELKMYRAAREAYSMLQTGGRMEPEELRFVGKVVLGPRSDIHKIAARVGCPLLEGFLMDTNPGRDNNLIVLARPDDAS